MNEPDDFDLSPVASLARVSPMMRSPRHAPFWKAWNARVWADSPELAARTPRDLDPSDDSADHQFESAHHTRIGCTLVLPADPSRRVRLGVVTTHGYESPPRLGIERDAWQDLANRGAAVLVIRVRGYAGSQADVPVLRAHLTAHHPRARADGGGLWITHGLESEFDASGMESDWVLPRAVADVANACRALRSWTERRTGERVPIALHGESFGAGLAVLAASALLQHEPIDRLVLALPAFGDWKWRLAESDRRCAGGSARHIRDLVKSRRDREESIRDQLHICDAVVHARRVKCPVLAKLALRDDTVPAPAAAAVFNELRGAPSQKLRFVTRYGHFDGGLADARRHAIFARLATEFLDPSRDASEAIARCEQVLASTSHASAAASAGATARHGSNP